MKFIGLGTGKCGSTTFSVLINKSGVECIHERDLKERVSWCYEQDSVDNLVNRFKKKDNYGEIALFYLPYVPMIAHELPEVKFICLQREREDFVNSFIASCADSDPFCPTKEGINYEWDLCYPKYAPATLWVNTNTFYRNYYAQASYYEKIYKSRFKIFKSEILYTLEGQKEVYKYLGVENGYFQKGIRENVGYKND